MCYSRTKGKHLTLQDRNDILSCLQRNLKLIEIAHYIHCDPRTISKEIQRNRILKTTSSSNQCIHRFSYHIIGLCGFCLNKECRSCKLNNCKKNFYFFLLILSLSMFFKLYHKTRLNKYLMWHQV